MTNIIILGVIIFLIVLIVIATMLGLGSVIVAFFTAVYHFFKKEPKQKKENFTLDQGKEV